MTAFNPQSSRCSLCRARCPTSEIGEGITESVPCDHQPKLKPFSTRQSMERRIRRGREAATVAMLSPLLLLACLAMTPRMGQAFLTRAGPLSQQSVYCRMTLYSSGSGAFERTYRGVVSNPGQHRSQHKKRRRSPVGPAGIGTSSDRCRSYGRMGLRMSAIAAERAVADAAGGVETRVWKWKGYDIRYKVAGKVCSTC